MHGHGKLPSMFRAGTCATGGAAMATGRRISTAIERRLCGSVVAKPCLADREGEASCGRNDALVRHEPHSFSSPDFYQVRAIVACGRSDRVVGGPCRGVFQSFESICARPLVGLKGASARRGKLGALPPFFFITERKSEGSARRRPQNSADLSGDRSVARAIKPAGFGGGGQVVDFDEDH